METKPEQLLFYAAQGWPLLPLTWVQEASCSCGKPDCSSPGKHPLIKRGFKNASLDANQILEWHQKWPQANWGMRTGSASSGSRT